MSDEEDNQSDAEIISNDGDEEKAFDPTMQNPESVRSRIDDALETLENLSTAKRSRSEIMSDLAR